MSNKNQDSVEAAASLFATQDESAAGLFDSYFGQTEENTGNLVDTFQESSNTATEASSLFNASIEGDTSLFSFDSFSATLSEVEPIRHVEMSSALEPEVSEGSYDKKDIFSIAYHHNPDTQTETADYANRLQTYENESYQPNDAYSNNHYRSGQVDQWSTHTTPYNENYTSTYAPQVAPFPQHFHLQQNHTAPSEAYISSSNLYSSASLNPHYFSSSNFMPLGVQNNIASPRTINTSPTVTAYRPKITNAYDPPISKKFRTKSRYATPNSSLNFTTSESSHTLEVQPHNASPPQSLAASQESQIGSALSPELNLPRSSFGYDHDTQSTPQLSQAERIASKAVDMPTTGPHDIDFEREVSFHSPSFAEYHPGAGTPFGHGYGYARTISNSVAEPAKQGPPFVSYVPEVITKAAIHAPPIPLENAPLLEQDPPSSFQNSSFHNPQSKQDGSTNTVFVGHHASSKVTFLPISTAITQTPYAPSPTLIGANDPLGRARARIPVISFGFGGKLVSCFHFPRDAGGFDVSLTAHQTTSVLIRSLAEVLPDLSMGSNGLSFPGPLFSDPGASSLARTVGVGVTNQAKTKKTALIKWLDDRVTELANGLAYIAPGSSDQHKMDGRLVLLMLLKVMVENDGQLFGNSSTEWSVRSALVPRLRDEKPGCDGSSLDQSFYTPYLSISDPNEQSMTVHYAKESSLERIKEFLIRGEKVKAYHFAMDEKLWAHAMLIANSVDVQSFKEVAKEFIHSELGVKHVLNPGFEQAPQPNGKESLRVAYSLFSGQGASSIQELFPSISSSSNNVMSAGTQFTPVTLSSLFEKSSLTSTLEQSLNQWQETVSMILTQTPNDSAALTSLGDYLTSNGWFDAAHVCYLLSPRTSSFGGITVPSVRMVLVGSDNPIKVPNFHKEVDVSLLSEIAEFALSLSNVKGQDPFSGLPHLQAYKLLRAYYLAEMGHIEVANRYCEAIGNTIRASHRSSQFYTPAFIGALKDLSDRLTTIPQSDKSGSWISRTMAKPSFDTIGSWLEGRFSKIIVGEGEESVPSPSKESQAKATYGPFSHYSSISSAAPSAPPSRSATPYATTNTVLSASMMSQNPIDRAASAIDYARLDRRRTSPVQRVASAGAIAPIMKPQGEQSVSRYPASTNPDNSGADVFVRKDAWYSDPTPKATEFGSATTEELQGEFVSPMDGVPSGFTSNFSNQSVSVHAELPEEEEEDLGFGNSSTKRGRKHDENVDGQEENNKEENNKGRDVEPKSHTAKPELVQQSSSWFGSFWNWRRGTSQSPVPVVANLGEEKSFYYDKELKRWVNKNAPDTTTTSSQPPPPPRAKTASPSIALHNATFIEQEGTPSAPPPRSSSVAEPAKKPPRVRSNLVPKEDIPPPSSAPPIANSFDPPGLGNDMPVTNRTKSAAGKRNVRSRYVDVFQQNA